MINRNTAKIKALPASMQRLIEGYDDEALVQLAGALQGGIISHGMTSKQNSMLKRLKIHIPDLEDISNEFDFVSHERKMYIDSKSKGHNNNVPVKFAAGKYKEANKEGYDMFFVITGRSTGGWPVKKYEDEGIYIMSETDFVEMINGKTKRL